jgi:hypothetical protein
MDEFTKEELASLHELALIQAKNKALGALQSSARTQMDVIRSAQIKVMNDATAPIQAKLNADIATIQAITDIKDLP